MFFAQQFDASKLRGIYIYTFAYDFCTQSTSFGNVLDNVDEICKMSVSSVYKSFLSFTETVIDVSSKEYLRHPYESDIKRILAINAGVGFPGYVGSWDCNN